jgi:hypothetical protein
VCGGDNRSYRIGVEDGHGKRDLWKFPNEGKMEKDEEILCNGGCLLTGPAHTQQIYRDGEGEEIGTVTEAAIGQKHFSGGTCCNFHRKIGARNLIFFRYRFELDCKKRKIKMAHSCCHREKGLM